MCVCVCVSVLLRARNSVCRTTPSSRRWQPTHMQLSRRARLSWRRTGDFGAKLRVQLVLRRDVKTRQLDKKKP